SRRSPRPPPEKGQQPPPQGQQRRRRQNAESRPQVVRRLVYPVQGGKGEGQQEKACRQDKEESQAPFDRRQRPGQKQPHPQHQAANQGYRPRQAVQNGGASSRAKRRAV